VDWTAGFLTHLVVEVAGRGLEFTLGYVVGACAWSWKFAMGIYARVSTRSSKE
jgi:hypothetical protein